MGTPFKTDNRLSNLISLNETFTVELIEVLRQNYIDGELEIGSVNYPEDSEFGVIYTIVDSEFENVIVHFIYKHTKSGYSYELNVEMRYLDSPVEWKISVDDYLISKLPKEMIKEMDSKLDKLFDEYFNID